MVLLTLPDEEEYVTYLTALTKSADTTLATQALATLEKYGFNPAEPRAAGRWTSGGTTTSTSETQQRRSKEQRQRQAQARYGDAVQGNEVGNRLAHNDATHTGTANSQAARDAARKKYGIPTGRRAMRGVSAKRRIAAAEILRSSVRMAHLKARQEKLAARVAAIDAEASRANTTGRTQATLARRRESAVAALKTADARVAAEQRNLTRAIGAWNKGKKAKKKA